MPMRYGKHVFAARGGMARAAKEQDADHDCRGRGARLCNALAPQDDQRFYLFYFVSKMLSMETHSTWKSVPNGESRRSAMECLLGCC